MRYNTGIIPHSMDFGITQDIERVLGILTFTASTVLGITVFKNNAKSATNKLFLFLAFLIDIYIVVNYISLHPPYDSAEVQLFWIRIVMMVTSFIGPILILLVHTFPRDQINLRYRYFFPLIALMTASAFASLTPLVFSSLEFPGGKPVPVPGPGIPLFLIDFVGLFLVSFIILIHKYRKAIGEEKKKLWLFLVGVIASFSLMGLSTVLFVVLLRTSATVFLGPIFPVILMSCIAYAIVKHNIFNVQVFSTQILVGLISIVLFSKIFMAQSAGAQTFDIILFLVVSFAGYILVGSVSREIEQRQKLGILAASLEKANLQLKELDQQKTEFLSIASHQLRTPLSIIKGYIELITDGVYGKIPAKVAPVLSDMNESNERLVSLVDQFLDVTRIEQERTKFDFKKADLAVIAKSVVKELAQKAQGKGLKVKMDVEKKLPSFFMDEDKIRHVVFNFVDNAIKYSDNGTIQVLVSLDDERVNVRVQDQGFGFNREDEVNFFQKFYRGKNVEGTNVNGTGLGIYVCKKFIEAHGGEVWAKSAGLGKGSEFGFWIPLKLENE